MTVTPEAVLVLLIKPEIVEISGFQCWRFAVWSGIYA